MENTPKDTKSKEDLLFEELRSLLLEDDQKKLETLNEEVVEPEKLSARVNPLIDEKIRDLRDNFPEYFGETITATIKRQIVESQDEVVEALYPIMGKLIKKYIQSEIAKLSERISTSIKKSFSFRGAIRRFFNKLWGINNADDIIVNVMEPIIEEVFVIQKDSGLLVGSHSTGNIADKDMISGMLTAIKSFAEEAFSKESQNLETVGYETFQLVLNSYQSIYIAIAVSGVLNAGFRDKLHDKVTNFATVVLAKRELLEDETALNELIKKHFDLSDN